MTDNSLCEAVKQAYAEGATNGRCALSEGKGWDLPEEWKASHAFASLKTPATQPTDNTGLIERAREAAARYFENDHIDKARKAVAVLIRKGGTMDDQDATQIALYALAEADRQHAAALATKDAEIAAAYEALEEVRDILIPPGNVWTGNEPDWQAAAYRIAHNALGAKP